MSEQMNTVTAEQEMHAKRAAKKAEQKAAKVAKPKAAKKAKPAKKAAKVAKPKAPKQPAGERLIPAKLDEYVKDKEHKTAGGNVSVHCGDEVAEKLLGKSLDQVYTMAAKACKVDEKELRTKYANLNVGMQRMNLGNKIRGAAAKAAAA